MVLERLQLQLLQLLRVEAELVVPELRPRVDERRAQGLWKYWFRVSIAETTGFL